jgi:biotin synthase
MLSTDTESAIFTYGIDRDAARLMSEKKGIEIYDLFLLANKIRNKFKGNTVDLCSIINAKSGSCPEDCSFCAQSAHSKRKTETKTYSLLNRDEILGAAESAKKYGVKRFCIVTSGRKPSKNELKNICKYIYEIRNMGLLPCATLGMLDIDELRQLKDSGLNRYHHNLETSEAFFSEICSTHTYRDKIRTIEASKSLGLSICSGGIFGLGETWDDRIDMAFALKELDVDSVPINFLTPVKGTPLDSKNLLNPLEALKIIAIFRLLLPDKEIRVCGGRPMTLRDLNSQIFLSGADGLLIGNYLTTEGRRPEEDLQMIRDMGLEI